MDDEKMIEDLRLTTMSVNMILMFVTVTLQTVAFEPLRHTILCSCVLLFITITLVFDGILKDREDMIVHGSWYALWLFNLIMNLFKF